MVQAFYIPSNSMEQTLMVGDRVLVNKVPYIYRDPHRGEIVVFNGLDNFDEGVTFTQPSGPVGKAVPQDQQHHRPRRPGREGLHQARHRRGR